MISERALKGQTDKLYFCTSLAPLNVIPSGSLALLLLQAQQLHKRTCIYQHPTSRATRAATPRLATSSCCRSLRLTKGGMETTNRPRVRLPSKMIGAEFCQHNSAREPLAFMSAKLKKQAAAGHPGLCGHPHAWVIAAVKMPPSPFVHRNLVSRDRFGRLSRVSSSTLILHTQDVRHRTCKASTDVKTAIKPIYCTSRATPMDSDCTLNFEVVGST